MPEYSAESIKSLFKGLYLSQTMSVQVRVQHFSLSPFELVMRITRQLVTETERERERGGGGVCKVDVVLDIRSVTNSTVSRRMRVCDQRHEMLIRK